MARDPLGRRTSRPVPPPASRTASAAPVIGSLIVAGVLIAVGIPWLAGPDDPAPPRAIVTAAEPAATHPGIPDTADRPEAPAPGTARAFLDPAGAGATAYAAGDYEGALAQYYLAVERNPQDSEAHSNLGQMLVRLKRPAEALPYFDRAIQLLPVRWAYHFNRARALGLLDRWDEAIAGYRQAQGMFPDDYATAFNLGQALHRKGDEVAAVEAYLRAIELNETDPTFRMALGISYERQQKTAEAAAAYDEYLRLSPDAADAEQVRGRIVALRGPAHQPTRDTGLAPVR